MHMRETKGNPEIAGAGVVLAGRRWDDRPGTLVRVRDGGAPRKVRFIMGWELDDVATAEGERRRRPSAAVRHA
jgi:hypothetical protein